jgi:hypothetical protein
LGGGGALDIFWPPKMHNNSAFLTHFKSSNAFDMGEKIANKRMFAYKEIAVSAYKKREEI